MITYKDMTFCPFWKECATGGTCHRALTASKQQHADEIGLPVAYYVEKPDCFKEDNER